MMDLHEIRRRNLAYLGERLYSREQLALALGYPDTNYINGVISGHTTLGTKNASKFGVKLKLGENWFNEVHEDLWLGLATLPDATASIGQNVGSAIDRLSPDDLDLILKLAQRLAAKD
jgi:hypothetical protein